MGTQSSYNGGESVQPVRWGGMVWSGIQIRRENETRFDRAQTILSQTGATTKKSDW